MIQDSFNYSPISGGETTENRCPKCGKPYWMVWQGITPAPVCRCVNNPASVNFETGWQCPACKIIYAPHVNSCWCKKEKENEL